MLGLRPRKQDADYRPACRLVYARLLTASRALWLYDEAPAGAAVPDTFDGRFEALCLHVFLVMERLLTEGQEGRDFNQSLFDVMFADMDQTLREMGIGDMGVPAHMRRMMTGFNGRAKAYAQALAQGEQDLEAALRRNVYGTCESVAPGTLARLRIYALAMRAALSAQSGASLLDGDLQWPLMGRFSCESVAAAVKGRPGF